MIYVTAYKPEAKGKVKIQLDNGMSLTAYRSELRQFHMEEGAGITEEDYHKLVYEVIAKRAKKRAMHLLEQMDRTEYQLRTKLKSGGYPEICIDAAIEYVTSFHYLDDCRYAASYVRYRQERMSRRQLLQKLAAKGITKEVAEQALEAEYDASERQQIAKLLQKRQFVRDKADETEFRRTYQYLLRRGFLSSEILSVMKSAAYQQPDY